MIETSIIGRPDWVKKLEAQPCECVMCKDCRGTGRTPFSFGGERLYGGTMGLYDLEYCEFCVGNVAEQCDRCAQLNDWWNDQP